MNRARLEQRKRDDHALILATRAQRAMPPPTSWWAEPGTWDEWTARHRDAAQRMNAVTTTYRKAEERS